MVWNFFAASLVAGAICISVVESLVLALLRSGEMKRISILVILGLLVWAGIYLRFMDLGRKPMHTDEAVNAVMVVQSMAGEKVYFDPGHYHGPLLRYLAVPVVESAKLISEGEISETRLRWLTALAGGVNVLLIGLFRKPMGVDACLVALVAAAVSPALIYYNRYFIHESVFVLFSLVFLYFLWRWMTEKTLRWAICTGVLAGLLHAVRETVVLVLFSAVVAIAVSFYQRRKPFFAWLFGREGLGQLAGAVICAVFVSVLFYSAFFTHWQGPLDSVLTYFNYSTEAGHEKPWYYYLKLMVGENTPAGYMGQAWLLLLGGVGLWQAVGMKADDKAPVSFTLYIAGYTIASTVVYSLIAYKTPWLMMNFLVGWILLAGIGSVYLWEKFTSVLWRAVLVVILIGCLAQSVRQSWLLGFRYAADPRNPYVYSHTSPDLLKLVDRIEILSRFHPDGKGMRIDIAGTEYWPLPWYLRHFTGVGYWPELMEGSEAPVQIVSFSGDQDVPELDPDHFITDLRGLREGVFLLAFIDKDLWDRQFTNP